MLYFVLALWLFRGRRVPAGPLGRGVRVGDRESGGRCVRRVRHRGAVPVPAPAAGLRPGDADPGGPELPVLVPGPRCPRHRGADPVARFRELRAQAGEGTARRHLPGGTEAAAQKRRPARHGAGHRVHRAHRGRRRRRGVLRGVLPGRQPSRYGAVPGAGPACCYPDRWGCETVIGHHKTDMGEGQAVLRSKDPERVAQEMWALFAVYQATCQLIGAGVNAAGIPPDRISFPHALAAAIDTVAAFPPDQLDLALAMFLLKILMPGFHVRDRPGRASPRKTKKAGDFPARKPGEPSVTNVTRRIELHLLYPWQVT